MSRTGRNVLPGFGLTLGFAMLYLSLIVLAPLSTIFFKSASMTWPQFWATITAPRTLAACRLSFSAALIAALANSVLGTIVADSGSLQISGARVDAMVDLPFALPIHRRTTLTAIYATNG